MVAGLDVNRTRLAWLIAGTLLVGAMVYVVYSFVGTFVFGLFIYYATRPVYRRINRRVGDRRVAAAVSLFVLALPLLGLFAYTLAIGLQQLDRIIDAVGGTELEEFEAFLGPYIDVSEQIGDPAALIRSPELLFDQPGFADAVQTLLDQGLGFVTSVGGFVGNALLHVFIMVALAYYLLVDGKRFSRWVQSLFADDNGVVDQFARNVDRDFEAIFFGNILNAIITGIIGALVYSALDIYVAPAGLNVPYAALVGLLAGAGSLVPVVGMKIVYVPVTLWLVLQSLVSAGTDTLWFAVVFALVSFIVVDVIPDLGLRPYVSGRNIHTGAVMLAYIFGPLLFGWYGLFLGPILLVLVTHFTREVVPELIAEREFAPFSVDPTYVEALGVEPTGADPGPAPPGDPADAGGRSDGGDRVPDPIEDVEAAGGPVGTADDPQGPGVDRDGSRTRDGENGE